jgi:type II secretory pathway predicted ATPase ExeA
MNFAVPMSKLRGMYEKHFGLDSRPFQAKVPARDVFVGPQTVQTMAGLRKALQVQDAVVSISGPAGCGKSTLVGKSLEALGTTHRSCHIGRLSLDVTDVLEFLLEELGEKEVPRGTIRQFTALRAKFCENESAGKRVVIVVEDAMRLGAETLAELEALTAADGGDSEGAALILMGDESTEQFLADRQLTRLSQRIRLRRRIHPMSEPEVRGYLIHCCRLAGGDFTQLFEESVAALVCSLSNGIPRVANNLLEAAMAAAAVGGTMPVAAALVAETARREFGLEADPARADLVDTAPFVTLSEEACNDLDQEIPTLIQDTLTDLETLIDQFDNDTSLPDLERLRIDNNVALVSGIASQADDVPTVDARRSKEAGAAHSTPRPAEAHPDSPAPITNVVREPIPDWDRDPTMAELRPDLDALEKAMAIAQGDADDAPILEPETPAVPQDSEDVPEITLDSAIQESIKDNLIDERDSISASDTATGAGGDSLDVKLPSNKPEKADAGTDRIAVELAMAKPVDDDGFRPDDTLFGDELSLAAAQVSARVQSENSANDDDLSVFDTGATQMTRVLGSSGKEGSPGEPAGIEVELESDGHARHPDYGTRFAARHPTGTTQFD